MTKEIEHIIKQYRFIELNPEQRQLVAEFASNEDEYESLRVFLLQLDEAVLERKVIPSVRVKTSLDQLFDQAHASKRLAWYNRYWLLLWPEDVAFYRKPLIQFASLGLILSLGITLIPSNTKQQLAMNSVEKAEDKLVDEEVQLDDAVDKTEVTDQLSPALVDIAEEEKVERVIEVAQDARAEKTTISQGGWQFSGNAQGSGSGASVMRDAMPSPAPLMSSADDMDSYAESKMEVVSEAHHNYSRRVNETDMKKAKSTKSDAPAGLSRTDSNLAQSPKMLDLLTALY
jgi:hypothetical protein